MTDGPPARVFCPVCSARFPPKEDVAEGKLVRCSVCGQLLVLRAGNGEWSGERYAQLTDDEIRDRVNGFAGLRDYHFSEMKEEILEGLLAKRDAFGDFYCPCRVEHNSDYQCPCKPTRGGDVERHGKCHCGLFLKGMKRNRSALAI
ncbi:MAG: hypothetical protein JSV94_02790 [Methanobacteriota archaeon]|nr:MAG: hypothetical protein JSV94_02790 [Euryarchaeota archaeon]